MSKFEEFRLFHNTPVSAQSFQNILSAGGGRLTSPSHCCSNPNKSHTLAFTWVLVAFFFPCQFQLNRKYKSEQTGLFRVKGNISWKSRVKNRYEDRQWKTETYSETVKDGVTALVIKVNKFSTVPVTFLLAHILMSWHKCVLCNKSVHSLTSGVTCVNVWVCKEVDELSPL